ncbi:hypothetical protein G7054_g438 [Neopestalotiopsis clavispora]|nr:hypothetical protein G7054_g438 [Neopestalotiopsis clavispora]
MIFTPPSSPTRETHSPIGEADPKHPLIPWIEAYDSFKQADVFSVEGDANGIQKRPEGCFCDKSIFDCQAHHEVAASTMSLTPRVVAGQTIIVVREGPLPGLNKYGDVANHNTMMKSARRRANHQLRTIDPERYAHEMVVKKAIRDDYLRPVRESFPNKRQIDSNEELIPGIPSYSPPKQADTCSSEGGLYQPPASCTCNENVVDCQDHHQEAADSTSLAPATVVGQAFRVIRSGPLPGLNKYGDIPNRETRMKARRRCANRELRLSNPEQYAQEMEVKKAARDDYLRAQRMAVFVPKESIAQRHPPSLKSIYEWRRDGNSNNRNANSNIKSDRSSLTLVFEERSAISHHYEFVFYSMNWLSPVRESPPTKRKANTSDKLVPGIEPYDPFKQDDACSTEGAHGIPERPDGCSCDVSIINCEAHHQEAAGITSLTPVAVGHTGVAFYDGPLPGLNKYGDVPNDDTRKKAARRKANRVLREVDAKRYASEMVVKKAIRDDFLRAEREAGRR